MNNIRIRALALAIAAFAAPLFASSPEYQIGGTIATPAPNFRSEASIATDGDDFFVAWSDGRSYGARGDVIGTRVKHDGRVVDPLGIRLSSSGLAGAPQVVWDGGAYLVIWTETSWGPTYASNVHAARIDRDGQMVMQPRVIVENGATTPDSDHAASNGNVTVVAYLSYLSGPKSPARVVVLDRNGNTLHHEDLAPDLNLYRDDFAIAATPSRFVVAWAANPGFGIFQSVIEAVALTSDGHVIGTPVNVSNAFGVAPAIGTDGTGFAIVYRAWREPGVFELRSLAINADLTEIRNGQTFDYGHVLELPSVLWRGDRYEIVYGLRPEPTAKYYIVSYEIDRNGEDLDNLRRRDTVDGDIGRAVAATNGADLLVTFNSPAPPLFGSQVFGRVYRGSSLVYDAQAILSWSGNAHSDPEIASSAFGHFAAWNEEDGVFATRIDLQGRTLDGRGVQLTPYRGRARVAFDGTNYVVAWLDSGFIGVRYVAPLTGATVAEVHVPAVTWQGLSLAVAPEATYVVFADDRVRVTRIPHATYTPDPVPLAVSPEDMLVGDPASSWNGSTLLVTWNEIEYPRGDPPLPLGIRILGARVTSSLALLDPAPLTIATNADLEREWSSYGAPSVASDGEDWLVVADLNLMNVIARRVRGNGTVEGNAPTTITEGFSPVATWDGTRYAVVWRNENVATSERTIFLGAVPASGALVATGRKFVATKSAWSTPSISRAENEVAIAYTRFSFLPAHTGVERSYFRVMDNAPRARGVRR